MIYPKITKRYLASIVCCLILILGISTLLLVYKFHMRRSPLLVESLRTFEVSKETIASTGKKLDKSNALANNQNKTTKDDNNLRVEVVMTEIPVSRNTVKTSDEEEKRQLKFKKLKNINNINEVKHLEGEPNGQLDPDNVTYTDTIYIDDFEHGKESIFKQDDAEVKYTTRLTQSNFDRFEIDDDLNYNQVSSEYKFKNQKNGNYLRKPKLFSPPEKLPQTTTSQPTKIEKISGKFNESRPHFNLDVVYDRSQSFYENIDAKDNDDDAEDFNSNGSGSGDFSETLDFGKDQSLFYDNLDIKHVLTDWNEGSKSAQLISKRQQKNIHKNEKIQMYIFNAYSEDNEKTKKKKLHKENSPGEEKILHENRESSFHVKEKRNQESKTRSDLTTKSLRKQRNNKIKKSKKQSLLIPTEPSKRASTDKLKQLQSTLRPKQYIIKQEMEVKNDDEFLSRGQEGNLSAIDFETNSSVTTWLESRTRRIMGNVKKIEERSRQLLLCEEAGGGELCRMLFKGHTTK